MTIDPQKAVFGRILFGFFLTFAVGITAADDELAATQSDDASPAEAIETVNEPDNSLRILGTDIAAGTSQRLSWTATQLFEGVSVATPVLVINGAKPGPTLCLTAAIHGDELNGIIRAYESATDSCGPQGSRYR